MRRKKHVQRRRRVWSVGTHWRSCRNSGNNLKVCMDKEGMVRCPLFRKGTGNTAKADKCSHRSTRT